MWPGFGDNMRVLLWILDRAQGKGAATESPIGHLPTKDSLDVRGLDLSPEATAEILSVDRAAWEKEIADIDTFFAKFGDRLPAALKAERDALAARIKKA